MSLMKNVLAELDYRAQSPFSVPFKNSTNLSITPFISAQNRSQVYLVVTIAENDLHMVLSEPFLPAITECFRSQQYYVADMAKNTSLLIMNPCTERSNRSSEDKLHIEDDPFFFKKYVFSYTEAEEKKTQEYTTQQKEELGDRFCYVGLIQKYILDSDHFAQYKKQFENEPIYAYLAELCAKLPILPLSSAGTDTIKSVDQFLEEKIEEAATRKKDPIRIEKEKLDRMLTEIKDWKQTKTETIVAQWRIICESIEKGDND